MTKHEIIDIVNKAKEIEKTSIKEAYSYLFKNIKNEVIFFNRAKNKIKYLTKNQYQHIYTDRVILSRQSGARFEITLFKFHRNIIRGNLAIKEIRAYKRKKLIIKN